MLMTFILNSAYQVINWIIQLFPIGTGFPSQAHIAMAGLGGYLAIFDPLLPYSTLVTVLGILITVELSIFAFKTTKWIISHLPVIGGRG